MKRRILAAVCCVMLLVPGTACTESEVPDNKDSSAKLELVVNYFDDSLYDSETYHTYLECRGSTIHCTKEAAQAYPNLEAALDREAASLEASAKEYSAQNDEDAHAFAKENDGRGYVETDFSVVKRADEKAVSIARLWYGFSGGVHGNYGYFSRNFDPATGENIKLSDVVKDQEKLNGLLLDQLHTLYPDMSFLNEEDPFQSYDMDVLESDREHFAYTFTLDPDGICFYFSPYELGSYADGEQVVKLLYRDTPELFAKDYAVSGGYVSGMIGSGRYDLGGDGTTDEISYYCIEDEFNQAFEKIHLEKNGRELVSDIYCYSMDTFLMHTEDNRDYLYMVAHMDNDASGLYIYDLNGEKPTPTAVTEHGLRYAGWEEKGIDGYQLLTDVSDFVLTFRCDLLASFNAYFHTSVGADGTPVLPEDGFYSVPDTISSLQSVVPLKADVVDESGKVVKENAEIPAGERFQLLRTDGKTIVDAKISDGSIVRLELTRSDDNYTATVNGQISEEEAFQELYYAG